MLSYVRGLPGLALLLMLGIAPGANAVTIEWVTVGNPGNAADSTGYGAVADAYRISKYEVTNAQYTEFLNATVAPFGFNRFGVYNENMGGFDGGIAETCTLDCTYTAIAGRENMPVNYVSFYDALRFVNWMHNDQRSNSSWGGEEEYGAYTLNHTAAPSDVTRNAGASIFLPNEDEWYKAAYHNALGLSADDYFDYPAGSDAQTTCSAPPGGTNHANCESEVGDFTAVGSYTGSGSPHGTFDQGGNIAEWNEALIVENRGVRGGEYCCIPGALGLAAFTRLPGEDPEGEYFNLGFRVASPIPEPGTGILVMVGLLGLARWSRPRV